MFTRYISLFGIVGAVGAMATIGCGSSGGGSTGDGGASSTASTSAAVTSGGNTTSGASTFECCINSSHFTCPSQAAAMACANLDNPDPSGCQELASPCGNTSGPSTTAGSGNMSTGSGTDPQDDTGKQCEVSSECIHNTCLFKDGADVGFCSKTCMSFTECPTFWSCSDISNGSITYCVPD